MSHGIVLLSASLIALFLVGGWVAMRGKEK